MKICHISTGYPISFSGGITNYVRALANYQSTSGNEVWVVSNPAEGDFEFKVQSYTSEKIHPFKFTPMNDKDGLKVLKEFFDQHQFDIIHIHMMLDIDWNLYDVIKPYKYVVSLHDYFYLCPRIQMAMEDHSVCGEYNEERCMNCISWFNTNRIFNGVERRLAKICNFRFPKVKQQVTKVRYEKFKNLLENAEMLLPVSVRVQEIYENSGIKGNYTMLHIGNITADRFSEEFVFDYEKDKIDIAMLGTLMYMKGADLYIELAKRLDREKVNVHFYGRSASYADKLKEAGIIDHGAYTQEQLKDILINTDLGCVLSVWEDNGPQVVMEFLNNHVPVIGTRMGGIPDFVDETNGFLFDPFSEKDIDELVQRVNSLTREQIYQMKKSIKPTTTTKQHCEDIDKIYKSILED